MRHDYMFYLTGNQKCIVDQEGNHVIIPRFDVRANPSGKNQRAAEAERFAELMENKVLGSPTEDYCLVQAQWDNGDWAVGAVSGKQVMIVY
jgi:hypothetical protein